MTIRRIKINLTKIFSDYRKFAYITIDSKWKLVDDLEQHIMNLFGIKSKIYLTTDDETLIPAKEKIDIISLEDSIIINLMGNNETVTLQHNSLEVSQSSNEGATVKAKRKRKRKRKNKLVIDGLNDEIAEENGFDDEQVDMVNKRVTKILKMENAFKEELGDVVEPFQKEIPKLSITSTLPKIVYGY